MRAWRLAAPSAGQSHWRFGLSTLLLSTLLLTTLAACGDTINLGGPPTQDVETQSGAELTTQEDADAPEDTPTQDAQTQSGDELTTQEYAAALEAVVSSGDAAIEADPDVLAAFDALFGDLAPSGDELERMASLEADDSWSQEDGEFASEFAETRLSAVTDLYEALLRATSDNINETSGLRPPEHLSELHTDWIAALRAVVRLVQDHVEQVKAADTDIRSRADLADFYATIDALESGPVDPELERRVGETCLSLESRLEAELERDVSICDAEAQAQAEAEEWEPAPTTPEATRPESAPEAVPDTGPAATDREALVALYNAADGSNWTSSENWLSDRPLGKWYGVGTGADGRVDVLELYENALSGEIPADLGQLSNLEVLDLGYNALSGEIPADLGQLSNLEALYLEGNDLTGEIPADLGRIADLQWLDLSENDLTGEIPAELGNIPYLYWLGLSGNPLSGCVPDALRDVENNDFDELGLPFC